MVGSEQYGGDDCDPIGVSHRVLTYEVSPNVFDPANDRFPDEFRNRVHFSYKTSIKEVVTPKEVLNMMELDFNERKSTAYSLDDTKFLSILEQGIRKREDKHYEMPLPFRDEKPNLPNNKILAKTRLSHLQRRFRKDSKYRQDYTTFMENVINKGFAEKVPASKIDQDDGQVYYIPHHGVYHQKKHKISVVFDCSARYNGQSLNDRLLEGPNLTNLLIGVLCRFRQEPIAFKCDVEAMFHQFKVNKEHRSFLRFLW